MLHYALMKACFTASSDDSLGVCNKKYADGLFTCNNKESTEQTDSLLRFHISVCSVCFFTLFVCCCMTWLIWAVERHCCLCAAMFFCFDNTHWFLLLNFAPEIRSGWGTLAPSHLEYTTTSLHFIKIHRLNLLKVTQKNLTEHFPCFVCSNS